MQKIIDLVKPKRDVLYEAALSAANSIAALLTLKSEGEARVELDRNIFHKIFANDPTSPAIHWIDEDQYLIYYPAHSKPYAHKFTEKCKFVEVLSGVLYDANSDFKLFKGDKVKVSPSDNYAPYTLDQETYLRVCVAPCDSIFERVCK